MKLSNQVDLEVLENSHQIFGIKWEGEKEELFKVAKTAVYTAMHLDLFGIPFSCSYEVLIWTESKKHIFIRMHVSAENRELVKRFLGI